MHGGVISRSVFYTFQPRFCREMAKKKPNVISIPITVGGDDQETDAESIAQSLDNVEELDAAEALLALSEIEGAGEVSWSVTRVAGPVGIPLGLVARLTTSELSIDRLMEFGRGKYKVRGFKPGKGFCGQRTVDIAVDPVQRTTTPAPSTSGVQDMLALIKAESERKSESWKSWAAILIPALAPMLQSWMTPRREDGLADMVTALQGLKSIAQPQQSDQLEQFLRVLEVTKEFTQDAKSETGSNWIDLLRDALSGVKPMLERLPITGIVAAPSQQQLSAPTVSTSNIPTINPAPEVQPQTSPEDSTMLAMLAWLRATLQQLAFQAAKNGNPELYAEVVLDNVPPGVNVAEFKSHLLRDDWWSVLTQFCPEVAPYKGWMTQFRQYTLEMIEEQAKTQDSNESPE